MSHSSHSQLSNSYFTYHAVRPQPLSLLLLSNETPRSSRDTHFRPLYPNEPPPRTKAIQKSAQAQYADLMKTVDYRYSGEGDEDDGEPQRRSSFALSDIFGNDKYEIEISDILPSSPRSSTSDSSSYHRPSKRSRSSFTSKFLGFILVLRQKCRLASLRSVGNSTSNLDLNLAS